MSFREYPIGLSGFNFFFDCVKQVYIMALPVEIVLLILYRRIVLCAIGVRH